MSEVIEFPQRERDSYEGIYRLTVYCDGVEESRHLDKGTTEEKAIFDDVAEAFGDLDRIPDRVLLEQCVGGYWQYVYELPPLTRGHIIDPQQ